MKSSFKIKHKYHKVELDSTTLINCILSGEKPTGLGRPYIQTYQSMKWKIFHTTSFFLHGFI